MNIFAFDDCPKLSALWIDDVRKNKMILESCQMMSHCMHTLMPHHDRPVYQPFTKAGYIKHGCTLWVQEAWENFWWLLQYTNHCLSMRNRPHACYDLIPHFHWFLAQENIFPTVFKTPFSNNAARADLGISFKHVDNTNAAYRMYIRKRWEIDTIKLSWNDGDKPWWKNL